MQLHAAIISRGLPRSSTHINLERFSELKYQITKESDVPYFFVSLSGPFELSDLERCYVEIISHPGWIPGFDIIWDARECTFEHLSGEDLNLIGYMTLRYKEKRGKGRAAWVVGREIDFAVSRMFGMFNEDRVVFDFRVFRTLDDAKDYFCRAGNPPD